MCFVKVKKPIFVNVRLSTEKKKLVSQLSLSDMKFQSYAFETTKWTKKQNEFVFGLYLKDLRKHYH